MRTAIPGPSCISARLLPIVDSLLKGGHRAAGCGTPPAVDRTFLRRSVAAWLLCSQGQHQSTPEIGGGKAEENAVRGLASNHQEAGQGAQERPGRPPTADGATAALLRFHGQASKQNQRGWALGDGEGSDDCSDGDGDAMLGLESVSGTIWRVSTLRAKFCVGKIPVPRSLECQGLPNSPFRNEYK